MGYVLVLILNIPVLVGDNTNKGDNKGEKDFFINKFIAFTSYVSCPIFTNMELNTIKNKDAHEAYLTRFRFLVTYQSRLL